MEGPHTDGNTNICVYSMRVRLHARMPSKGAELSVALLTRSLIEFVCLSTAVMLICVAPQICHPDRINIYYVSVFNWNKHGGWGNGVLGSFMLIQADEDVMQRHDM